MLFQLVAVLWLPMNLLSSPPTLIGIVELALMGACLVVLLKPDSAQAILSLSALNVLDMALTLPHAPNHRMLSAFINLMLLCSGLVLSIRERKLDAAKLFALFAPCGRVSTLILYFFVTFHKINTDFLDPEVSCTAQFYQHILRTLPMLPAQTWVYYTIPWATLLVEAAIPILLFFRRTRSAGVILGVVFHSFLAIDVEKHFFDFSSTMLALLSLGVDRSGFQRIWQLAESTPVGALTRLRTLFICWYVTAFLFALFHGSDFMFSVFFAGRQILWWTFDAFAISVCIRGLVPRIGGSELEHPFCIRSPLLVALAGLVLLNGLTPYLGLKTRSSFDMYANLRVHDGETNHLLIPRTLDLFGYLEAPVRIITTSDPALMADYVKEDYLMPYFEFRNYLSTHQDISIEYARAGQTFTLKRAGDSPEFQAPPSMLARKLLWFRPIDAHAKNRCQW